MLAYHCKLLIFAGGEEIATFSIWEMTMHLFSGWISLASKCLPGALI